MKTYTITNLTNLEIYLGALRLRAGDAEQSFEDPGPAEIAAINKMKIKGKISFVVADDTASSPELAAVNARLGGGVLKSLRGMIQSRTPVSWELMANAPVITVGAANAASAISSPVNIPYNSPAITESTRCAAAGGIYPDTVLRIPRNIDAQAPGAAAAFTSSVVGSWSIATDSQEVEVKVKGAGFLSKGRVWVKENGLRKFAGYVPSLPADGSLYLVKLVFPAVSMREIEVEMSGGSFGGFNVTGTAKYGKKESRGLHLMVTGDSFTEGSGSINGYHDGWAPRFLRLIGADKKTISGIGSTGYGATNSGTRKNLLERLNNDVINLTPDVVFHASGLVDQDSQVLTNAPLVFDAIATALPTACRSCLAPSVRGRSTLRSSVLRWQQHALPVGSSSSTM